ncbi:N-6 DNA methylase [Leptospira bandrabouensis]|uniref:N-6 DNA methylase n=1 Tax=Leptospira bandrabouensis TaxID=2484903 RepID=UPI001EE8B6FA|nr:N-6 DNA methylase [Leptospira bandrabouensis]MCG6144041.1 SAM-dependent methyltransferase [Leptospira bandrabouensis]MCG6150918.1 SAM-dependent methyltransferase [Leptospira bandrabouensis]MCG6159702.1 SAM-dependent methyltransferase [Leptospira bandrabouensis]MCG6163635.1 SAM-dependent methyltransferase [Leptospira bandrabouensis]
MNTAKVISEKKFRGGYYTPSDVASAITDWAINSPNQTILEPSFGDGEFIKAIISRKKALGENKKEINKSLYGVEIDIIEFEKVLNFCKDVFKTKLEHLYSQDFFEWYKNCGREFDVALGNPPFIRFQNFPEPSRTNALLFSESKGIKLNRLTNIWVPFIILSVALLKENGRIGMVVPAELLQVSYAGPLRKYLIDSFQNIAIFTCNELIFENAEQEVLVVLASGKNQRISGGENIEVLETNSKAELITRIRNYKQERKHKYVNHSTEKWTKYFLNNAEIEFMRGLKTDHRVCRFGDFFEVDVGIVTGKNEYFLINKTTAERFKLQNYIKPIVGRSYQIKNETFYSNDWKQLWNENKPVGLLDFNKLNGHIPRNVKEYIEYGELLNIHKGYKCSIRKQWYKVPSIWVPDAFMFRQIHDFPHFVINNAEAVSTDTIHRVRKKKDKQFPQVLFYTYITAASAEIEGRSYGGGVLELEPSEAENLLIPNPNLLLDTSFDYDVSRKENGKFLLKNSQFVLKELLRFKKWEVDMLENIYTKLFLRRKNRN